MQWLFDANRLSEVEQICNRGIQLDPAAEEFSVFLMRALIRNRNPEKALEHYEHIRQLYRDTYGVTPSEELEMMKSVVSPAQSQVPMYCPSRMTVTSSEIRRISSILWEM